MLSENTESNTKLRVFSDCESSAHAFRKVTGSSEISARRGVPPAGPSGRRWQQVCLDQASHRRAGSGRGVAGSPYFRRYAGSSDFCVKWDF